MYPKYTMQSLVCYNIEKILVEFVRYSDWVLEKHICHHISVGKDSLSFFFFLRQFVLVRVKAGTPPYPTATKQQLTGGDGDKWVEV